MFKILDEQGNVFSRYYYDKEAEFENMVVAHKANIFGAKGIYFNIKKKIGVAKKGAAIPDGYYLDLTFHTEPKLYLVEIELNSHDVYGHIGEQILRFGIASETDKHKIKSLLLAEIEHNAENKKLLNDYFSRSPYTNANALLDRVVFDTKPAAVIVIDEATDELTKVLGQLTMSAEVIEVQKYVCGDKSLYKYTPFKDDVLENLTPSDDADELDTIVVPAREDGFKEEFLQNERWFQIRISSAMLDKIKYIAAYQVAPVSAITYVAEVQRPEKYKDTNKYILYFKSGSLKKINAVGLGKKKGQAPQAPRYTSMRKLEKAKTLDDLWE